MEMDARHYLQLVPERASAPVTSQSESLLLACACDACDACDPAKDVALGAELTVQRGSRPDAHTYDYRPK